jgi:membrane fusion protein (multidrug efflux system)
MLLAGMLMLGSCGEKNRKERAVEPVNVKTMTVQQETADGLQGYSGTIEEMSGSSLSFASVGTLRSVSVGESQMVRQGQLVATIDETSLKSAHEAALAAKEQALDAEQRMKLLHDAGSLPEIKWIEVQTQVRQAISAEKMAKKALTDTRLYAPFSGYVAEKQAEAGQSVAPGVPIVKLVRIDHVKVSISVPEEEIAQIHTGLSLQVKVTALGGKTFEAKVSEKGVTADALSRSYEVKGIIGNPQHELLPGMIAEVHLGTMGTSQHKEQSITLPAEIIQIDADNRPFVWTVVDNKAQKAYVTLGQNIGDNVQISKGLKAGDKVICEGQQKVSNGMKVNNGTEK